MFALDHMHYYRWLLVYIKDLIELDPSTVEAFEKYYFTIQKSDHLFSCMGVDQAHEQNNKLLKIHGRAIGILVNPHSLLRWSVSAPIITTLCQDNGESDENLPHYKATQYIF